LIITGLFQTDPLAEFELAIHEIAEAGQPLTSDVNKTYGDIKKYYATIRHLHINDLITVNGVSFSFLL
jgi:hypothetical protein